MNNTKEIYSKLKDYTYYSLKVNAYSQRKDQLNKAIEIISLIEKEYPTMIKKRMYN